MAKKKPPKAGIAAPRESMEWFYEQLALRAKERAALEKRARRSAKAAAELTRLRAADAVFAAIAQAAEKGETLAQVREKLSAKVRREAELNLELAFQNNVQRAYNAGRVRQFMDEDTLALRPFWVFDATMDHRTTELCKSCNATVLPASSKWWLTHIPPLHHRCRSTVRAVTPERAEELGIDLRGPRAAPSEGFGKLADALPRPNLAGVAPELKAVFRQRR